MNIVEIRELLDSTSRKRENLSKGYMILDDGSKVPMDSSRCGVFVGKAGTRRIYAQHDKSVVAYLDKR